MEEEIKSKETKTAFVFFGGEPPLLETGNVHQARLNAWPKEKPSSIVNPPSLRCSVHAKGMSGWVSRIERGKDKKEKRGVEKTR